MIDGQKFIVNSSSSYIFFIYYNLLFTGDGQIWDLFCWYEHIPYIPYSGEDDLWSALTGSRSQPGRQVAKHQGATVVTVVIWLCWFKHQQMAVCQNLVPLVNTKIAGKWMFILLKMVLIGINRYWSIPKSRNDDIHQTKDFFQDSKAKLNTAKNHQKPIPGETVKPPNVWWLNPFFLMLHKFQLMIKTPQHFPCVMVKCPIFPYFSKVKSGEICEKVRPFPSVPSPWPPRNHWSSWRRPATSQCSPGGISVLL